MIILQIHLILSRERQLKSQTLQTFIINLYKLKKYFCFFQIKLLVQVIDYIIKISLYLPIFQLQIITFTQMSQILTIVFNILLDTKPSYSIKMQVNKKQQLTLSEIICYILSIVTNRSQEQKLTNLNIFTNETCQDRIDIQEKPDKNMTIYYDINQKQFQKWNKITNENGNINVNVNVNVNANDNKQNLSIKNEKSSQGLLNVQVQVQMQPLKQKKKQKNNEAQKTVSNTTEKQQKIKTFQVQVDYKRNNQMIDQSKKVSVAQKGDCCRII